MAGKKTPIRTLLSALPKWLLIMVICIGVCFAVLAECGLIKLDSFDTIPLFGFSAKDDKNVPEEAKDFSVHFLDVGQGDCILVLAGEKSVLIDAGEEEMSDRIVTFLTRKGIAKLDMVIVTHPHSDHIGGMADVISKFGADKIIVPRVPDELVPANSDYERFLLAVKARDEKLTAAKAGHTYSLGEVNGKEALLTVLSPSDKDSFDNINDYSVAVRLDYGHSSWLFTGDLSSKGEKALIGHGYDVDVSVLKVGHHGSRYSSSGPFLKQVTPRVCVISCGKDNSYGHPHDEAVDRLSGYTDSIYRTDEHGTVSIYSDGDKLYINTSEKGSGQ